MNPDGSGQVIEEEDWFYKGGTAALDPRHLTFGLWASFESANSEQLSVGMDDMDDMD